MGPKGNEMCICHTYVNELEYQVTDGIIRTLDVDQKWKLVMGEASKNQKYDLGVDEISLIEQSHPLRPPHTMLLKFAGRGMKTQELVRILTKLGLEKALSYLYKFANDLLLLEEHPAEQVFMEKRNTLKLRCYAAGSTPVKYQWFHNDEKMGGEIRPELTIYNIRREDFGNYSCRVHKKCRCGEYVVLFTNPCIVSDKVESAKPPKVNVIKEPGFVRQTQCCSDLDIPELKFKAKDKVALLIGNSNYRTAFPLPAVKNDLVAFREILGNLGFRVFSFIDLDLQGMEKAILTFTAMLRDGVYGVFYFAGHGFEYGGESYMMPLDCKTGLSDPTECMKVNDLLGKMQKRTPALCAIFLDMCRLMTAPPAQCFHCGWQEGQENDGDFVRRGADFHPYCMQCHKPLTFRIATVSEPVCRVLNKAVFYATGSGEAAYEKEDGTQGVFMKSLVKCLGSPKTMPQLYQCMYQESNKNSSGNFQIPEAMLRILEDRTLHDENEYELHTAEYKHDHFWRANHNVPEGRTVQYTDGMVFTVDFQEMFSNVLMIEVELQTLPYDIEINDLRLKFPRELSILPEADFEYQNKLSKVPDFVQETDRKVFKLSEIQKLRNNLTLEMKLTYKYQGKRLSETIPLELGRPLVSLVWQRL